MGAIAATMPRYSEKQFDNPTRAKVRKITVKENRESLKIQADCILFVNRGQNIMLIDEQIAVYPGGYFKERNVINDYSWRFITNATPPTADGTLILSGNHVIIRILNGDGESDVNSDTEFDNPAKIDTGDISVSITPATPTADAPIGDLTLDTTINIPAGKTRVVVINKGSTVPVGGLFGNDASATGTCGALVKEIPVDPNNDGFVLEASGFNAATNTYGTLPAVTINNAGGAVIDWYAV